MVMVRVDVDHPSILLCVQCTVYSVQDCNMIDRCGYVGTMYSNISEKDESQT